MTIQHLAITPLKRAEKLEGKCKYTTNMISRLEKRVLLLVDKDLISLAYLKGLSTVMRFYHLSSFMEGK